MMSSGDGVGRLRHSNWPVLWVRVHLARMSYSTPRRRSSLQHVSKLARISGTSILRILGRRLTADIQSTNLHVRQPHLTVNITHTSSVGKTTGTECVRLCSADPNQQCTATLVSLYPVCSRNLEPSCKTTTPLVNIYPSLAFRVLPDATRQCHAIFSAVSWAVRLFVTLCYNGRAESSKQKKKKKQCK